MKEHEGIAMADPRVPPRERPEPKAAQRWRKAYLEGRRTGYDLGFREGQADIRRKLIEPLGLHDEFKVRDTSDD